MAAGSSTLEEPALTISRPRRFWSSPFGWSFAATACVAVVCAVLLLASNLGQPGEPTVLVLKGVMASKADYFDDAEVKRLLLEHGIKVEVTRRGSREVALEVIGPDTDQYDFAFPSGQPAADLIKNDRSRKGRYHRTTKLFTSPIVLATYREYADALVRKSIASPIPLNRTDSFYYTLETKEFLELGRTGLTWNDIGIRDISNGNRVLARTSGVCRSNSGATFLGLAAFVKNGEKVPENEADVARLAAELQPLILATGMPEADLFETYAGPDGKSQGPVVVVYEHQYLEHQIRHERRVQGPDPERVLLYPRQEFQTDPEFISLKEGSGDRLAELLATDPALRNRMVELGFRVVDFNDELGTTALFRYLEAHGIPAPEGRSDLTRAELPELDLLEKLIGAAGRCQQ